MKSIFDPDTCTACGRFVIHTDDEAGYRAYEIYKMYGLCYECYKPSAPTFVLREIMVGLNHEPESILEDPDPYKSLSDMWKEDSNEPGVEENE